MLPRTGIVFGFDRKYLAGAIIKLNGKTVAVTDTKGQFVVNCKHKDTVTIEHHLHQTKTFKGYDITRDINITLKKKEVVKKTTPANNKVPTKTTPANNKVPVNTTPANNKVPTNTTPANNKVPTNTTPTNNKVPVNTTPNQSITQEEDDNINFSGNDQVKKSKLWIWIAGLGAVSLGYFYYYFFLKKK